MPDIHPLAKLFQPLKGDEFDALVADIKANGLRNPITTYDNKVLDGQNRYRACLSAGVEPFFDTYDGDDPLGFVLSMNVQRRHLEEGQRALIAANVANMRQGARTDLAQPSAPVPEVSQAEAAKKLNVSERSVRNAKAVLDSGDAELIDAVKAGASLRKAAESVRPAPERPKPAPAAFAPADVMVQMRLDAQRLSGASLATLIAEWIMARTDVSLAVGSKPEVMAQLGGGVAARSSISAWLKSDVLDSQRASLVKEAIAAIKHNGERQKLIEEIAGGVASPVYRERI
jgi:ParB-like nuclease domain